MTRPYSYSVAELLSLRDTLPAAFSQLGDMGPAASSGRFTVPEVSRRATTSSADSNQEAKGGLSTEPSSLPTIGSQLASNVLQSTTNPGDGNNGDGEELIYSGHPAYHGLQKAWRLQRRRFADRSSQPFPAPTGSEAQRADNFKMFYEAVVSPSHVRVTAGGRIVPNIRGIPHATAHWDSELGCFEDAPNSPMEPKAPWLSGATTTRDEPNSILKGLPAADHALFDHTLPYGPATVQNIQSLVSDQMHGEFRKDLKDGSHDSGAQNEFKISPPSQFDSSRPFIYNGQLVYPVPPDFQIPAQIPGLPVNMLGNPNIAHQPFVHQHGHVGQPPLQFAQPMIPAGPYHGQHGPLMSLPGFNHLGMPMQLGPMNQIVPNFMIMPQMSMPDQPVTFAQGPADLVNNVQGLEQQLEQLECQLRNSKDQNEKQQMVTRQVYLQSQIIALQKILGTQMNPRGSSVHEQPVCRPSLCPAGAGKMSMPASQTPGKAAPSMQVQTPENKTVLSAADAAPALAETPPEKVVNSNKTDSSGGGMSIKMADSERSQLKSRKLLQAAAAMAAPFQPRSQKFAAGQAPALNNKSKMENIAQGYIDPTGLTQTIRQTGFTASSTTSRRPTSEAAISTAGPSFAAFPRTRTMYSSVSATDLYIPPISLQSFSSFPAASSVPVEHAGSSATLMKPAEPYLCGYVPFGMPSGSAKSINMVYRRELTEEERRARELYWGKAPPELSRGLPKFDGKDFYPPSPVKDTGRPKIDRVNQNQSSNHNINNSSSFAQRVLAKSEQSVGGMRSDFGIDSPLDLKFDNCSDAKSTFISGTGVRTADPNAWGPLKTVAGKISLPLMNKASRFKGKDATQDNTNSIGNSTPAFNRQQTQPIFQQRMLRSSPYTAMGVATDGLSSATARGYLTQYPGSAAASLAPSMTNVSASSQVYGKSDKAARSGTIASARTENRPLSHVDGEGELLSAADLLRKVKLHVKEVSDIGFNSKTTGIGPVYDGEDW